MDFEAAKAKRKQKENELNQLAEQWYQSKETRLPDNLWFLVFDLYNNTDGIKKVIFGLHGSEYADLAEEVTLETFSYVIKSYDPQKGKFSHLFAKKRYYVIQDKLKDKLKDLGGIAGPMPDIEGDNEAIGSSTLDSVNKSAADYVFDELTRFIIEIPLRLGSRAGNETCIRWMRMFLAEDLTNISKTAPLSLAHESETFQTLHTDYLDYFMARICRTVNELCDSPLKKYKEVIPDCSPEKSETELPVPFEALVSLSFLRKEYPNMRGINNSSRSEYFTRYKNFRNELKNLTY